MSRPRNELRYLQVITLREGGRTYCEIGTQIGISYQRVGQILRLADRSDLCGWHLKPKHPCRICGAPIPPHRIYCSHVCSGLGRRKPDGITAKAEAAIPLRAKGMSWGKIAEIVEADKWSLYSVCQKVVRSQGYDPKDHWAFYKLSPPGRPPKHGGKKARP